MRRLVPAAVAAILLVPAAASAHLERTSYWPDPRPDTAVKPAAGGKVPKVRSLASSLKKKPPGKTLVVCQPGSLKAAKKSIASARRSGYKVRPTAPVIKLKKKQAKKLLKVNRKLFKRCKFHEVQPAATAARNNDRIVIMPGVYTEPASRSVPQFPPECEKYRTTSEKGAGAAS